MKRDDLQSLRERVEKADDVKVLRFAAETLKRKQPLHDTEWAEVMSILCARMADMIEREEEPESEYDEDGPGHIEGKPAGYAVHIDRVKEREAAAEDRGWNEALDTAINEFAKWFRKSPTSDRFLDTLIALRREPRP